MKELYILYRHPSGSSTKTVHKLLITEIRLNTEGEKWPAATDCLFNRRLKDSKINNLSILNQIAEDIRLKRSHTLELGWPMHQKPKGFLETQAIIMTATLHESICPPCRGDVQNRRSYSHNSSPVMPPIPRPVYLLPQVFRTPFQSVQ